MLMDPGGPLADESRLKRDQEAVWANEIVDQAWNVELEDLMRSIVVLEKFSGRGSDESAKLTARNRLTQLAAILQARSTLDAAEAQRTEARELVSVTKSVATRTWWLTAATWALAIGTLVAIFLRSGT